MLLSTLRALADEMVTRAAQRTPLEPAPHLFLPPYHTLAYQGFDPATLRALAATYAARAAMTSAAPPAPPPRAIGSELRAVMALAADRRPVVGHVTTSTPQPSPDPNPPTPITTPTPTPTPTPTSALKPP